MLTFLRPKFDSVDCHLDADPDPADQTGHAGHGGQVTSGQAQQKLDGTADKDGAADDEEDAGHEPEQRCAAAAGFELAADSGAGN